MGPGAVHNTVHTLVSGDATDCELVDLLYSKDGKYAKWYILHNEYYILLVQVHFDANTFLLLLKDIGEFRTLLALILSLKFKQVG